ncbi:MAG: universal stress protein [Sulfitobacter sp.]
MYQKILVPMALDHDISPKTLEIARALAGDSGKVIALHVYEEPSGTALAYLDEGTIAKGFETVRQLFVDKLEGSRNLTGELVKGHVDRTIIDYVQENDIDCIVMGSHRPGLSDYLLGSTTARVVRHAPCAVHVYRGR